MVHLTEDIGESLAAAGIVFLATSSGDSVPNVVPIKAFRLLDDETLLISDQFFNKTLQNMKENPKAALSWWGEKGGFQIKGAVTIHTDDEVFREDVTWMQGFRPGLSPKSAVILKISDVYQVRPGADAGKKIL
ncbi:MAG: pyridoxamine 5'-phosphate oxidase family protein [Methanoregulaceae archaeon]